MVNESLTGTADKSLVILGKLMYRINLEVKNGLEKGEVTFQVDYLLNWKYEEFQYADNGPKFKAGNTITTQQKNWKIASHLLTHKILETDEFLETLRVLELNYPDIQNIKQGLENFCFQYIYTILNERSPQELIKDLVYRFFRDLNQQPFHCNVVVYLIGIILTDKKIMLSESISLRQTERKDIEIPTEIMYMATAPFMQLVTHPTAILEMNFESMKQEPSKIQSIIQKFVSMLRLFKVGSVETLTYSLNYDCVLYRSYGSLAGGGKHKTASHSYKVGVDNHLEKFIEFLEPKIPGDLYTTQKKEISFLSIAFDRYTEALLEPKNHERNITSAIMGLEAIYSTDSKELLFKLQQRIAKVMGIIGKNGLDVAKHVNAAYNIRSTYAHGGHLSEKEKVKIANKNCSVDELLFHILGYLRLSILLFVTLELKKKLFITLIDQAMIDERSSLELENTLQPFIQKKSFING